MHIILTQQEINNYIQRYLNIPSYVEVTVSIQQDTPEVSDGWIVNTQKQDTFPLDLDAGDRILVEFTNGDTAEGISASWDISWNIQRNSHIIKYRKL